MLAYYRTDVGLVRKRNEDNLIFIPSSHLFAVADGMGGHVAGEVASSKAAQIISDHFNAEAGLASPEVVIEQAIIKANRSIYELAQSQSEYAGMGTTVTAIHINNNNIYWGHVGDSRLYLVHENKFEQITKDHSLVGELLRNGNITKDEAQFHPNRNILTRAVGTGLDIKIDIGTTQWVPGDSILLCTDGLTSMVSESEICEVMTSYKTDGNGMLDMLLSKAKTAGGHDNITMIWIYHGDVSI